MPAGGRAGACVPAAGMLQGDAFQPSRFLCAIPDSFSFVWLLSCDSGVTAGPVTALAAASALSQCGPPSADPQGGPGQPGRGSRCHCGFWIAFSRQTPGSWWPVQHCTPHGCSSLPGMGMKRPSGGAARGQWRSHPPSTAGQSL